MTITIKLIEPTDYTVLRSVPNNSSIDNIKQYVNNEWGANNWVSIKLPNNKEIRNA